MSNLLQISADYNFIGRSLKEVIFVIQAFMSCQNLKNGLLPVTRRFHMSSLYLDRTVKNNNTNFADLQHVVF